VTKRVAIACAVLSLLAATVGAQSPTLPSRLGNDAVAAIGRVIDSARVAGLPTSPLFDKAAEGVLKGADDQRIIVAVRSLARELGEARSVIGSSNDAALLGATASALHAGATSSDLRQLARPTPGDPADAHAVAAAFVALADLVTKHVSPANATNAIRELLKRRASDVDFTTLRGEVDQDIRGGMAPDIALTNRMRAHVQVLDAIPLDRGPVKRPPPVL
jgi:hypothetical protein